MKKIVFLFGLLTSFSVFAENPIIGVLDKVPYSTMAFIKTSPKLQELAEKAGGAVEYKNFTLEKGVVALKQGKIIALYPLTEHQASQFNLDKKYITSQEIGFAERKDNKINWEKVDELKELNVGLTQENLMDQKITDEILEKYTIKISDKVVLNTARTDVEAIKWLAGSRNDIIAIDRAVFDFQMRYNKDLTGLQYKIELTPQILDVNALYAVLSKKIQR